MMRRHWIAGMSLILALAFLCGVTVGSAFAGWTAFIPPQVSDDWTLNQVSFPASNEGWAVGADLRNGVGVLLFYRDGTWSQVTPPAVSNNWTLADVSFVSTSEGWAVGADLANGRGVLLHYAGGTWEAVSPLPVVSSTNWSLRAVQMLSATEGWAAGADLQNSRGVLLHYLNGSWSVFSSVPAPATGSPIWRLNGLHFLSPAEGWAVGDDLTNGRGALYHYVSGVWNSVTLPFVSTNWGLEKVNLPSSSEGWAVGSDAVNGSGVLLHYAGGAWTAVSPPAVSPDWELHDVYFSSVEEGWAVGGDFSGGAGVLLHYFNGTWTNVPPPQVSPDWELTGLQLFTAYAGMAVGRDRDNNRAVLLAYSSPPPVLTVTPNVVQFGNVMMGTTSEQSAQISNTGQSDLILRTLVLPGGPFGLTGGTCAEGVVLAPGQTCSLTVGFSPTAAGAFQSQIGILSNDPAHGDVELPLLGGSGPDLTGNWVSFSKECGGRKEVRCRVSGVLEVINIGNQRAPTSQTRFYLSDTKDLDETAAQIIGRKGAGKIKPSKSRGQRVKAKLDRGVTPSGKYLIAVLDAEDRIVEADKTNNIIVYGPIQ
jgi:hypothetical protein